MMSELKSGFILLTLATITAGLMACESKLSESPPEGYGDPTLMKTTVEIQDDYDKKIVSLQGYIDDVRSTLKLAQDILRSEDMSSPMSIFDVIYEINQKAQLQALKVFENSVLEKGTFEIKSKYLEDNCQSFNYELRSGAIQPVDYLQYSMGSCYTKSDLYPVLRVNFKSMKKLSLVYYRENMEKVLPPKEIKANISECQFGETDEATTTCKDVSLGETKKIRWFADLVKQGKTVLTVRGISQKTGKVIYRGEIEISAKGKVVRNEIATMEKDEE